MRGFASWFPARWLTILFYAEALELLRVSAAVAEARRTLQELRRRQPGHVG